MIDNVKHRLLI